MLKPLGQVKGPIWIDRCQHPKKTYLCSFSIMEKIGNKLTENFYDLYVFPAFDNDAQMCLRYGREDSDHRTPGSLLELAIHAETDPVHLRAIRLIQKLGTVSYKHKRK